jgi:chaperonin GroES
VLVKRLEENTKTAGGIIIPDTAKEKPSEGIVEAVGNGYRAEVGQVIPLNVKVGDKVLFGKWSGTEVKVNGEVRLLIRETEILGVVEE